MKAFPVHPYQLSDPARMAMGLRPLAGDQPLFAIDDQFDADLRARHRAFAAFGRRVVDALPGSEAGQGLILDLVEQETDQMIDVAGSLIWRAGQGVQDDLCLLQRVGDDWLLTAGCVTFPAFWCMADKLAGDVSFIHGPVPGFQKQLAGKVALLFDRMDQGQPLIRYNWSLSHLPDLCCLPEKAKGRAGLTFRPDGTWLRIERQSLTRLDDSHILFGIRTYIERLDSLTDTAWRQWLGRAMGVMDPEHIAYKGLSDWRDGLMTWSSQAGEYQSPDSDP